MRTVLGVLVGRRDSILAAYHSPATLWLGLAFVLVAGLARDYDAADLSRDPWWLVVPAGASAVVALAIYGLARVRVADRPPFWSGYRRFLGLVWLMSPMALLYGIPWERLAEPGEAVRLNLWTLALVSAWRVALAARVVHVLTDLGGVPSLLRVSLIAGSVAALALFTVPAPVFQVMGGIRQTSGERLLASTIVFARAGVVLSSLFWLVGGLVSLAYGRGRWVAHAGTRGGTSWACVVLPAVLAAPFVIALPATQREQRLRDDAEALMLAGKVDEALAMMSSHRREEFPPQWDPPPLIGWSVDERPPLLDVVERVVARDHAGWVRDVYVDKFERRFLSSYARYNDVDAAEWARARNVIARLAPTVNLAERHELTIAAIEQRLADDAERTGREDARRAATRGASRPTTQGSVP
ncbi:MAG: hypothetical protein ACAI43_20915 [Phycisphaerae bacterium]|nr:hypothetical protein [Tepidisphaeraceae bacterium]